MTFGAGNTYSFTSGTFQDVGQNVSFSNGRVNMTNYGYSKSGTMSSLMDIGNGGSNCITLTWSDGSMTSNFLGTLISSIGGYYIYLEEGIRKFVSHSYMYITCCTCRYTAVELSCATNGLMVKHVLASSIR